MLATSRQPGASDQSVEEIQQIHDGVERAAGIVRNLVAFTETRSGRWHDVSRRCCKHELQLLGVVVDRASSARLPMVYVDGRQLEKAVTALVARPARAAELGRTAVTVSVVASLVAAPDDRVVLTIADMARGHLAQLHGAVIEAHGGTLTVASPASGSGRTKTIIELPIAVAVAAARAQETSPKWTESSTSSTSIANGISTS